MRKTDSEPKQVSDRETEVILKLAQECLALEGDFVEMGCYRGDTSLLLQRLIERSSPAINLGSSGDSQALPEYETRKRLWIYDSFEGLPEKTVEDASAAGDSFKAGELMVTKREVVERFKKAGLKVPRVKKGFFEDLTEGDLPEKIAFAFLDGDLYRSIRTSLKLVAPKMVKGGIIIVHDYNNPQLPGVTKAVNEFAADVKQVETLAIIS